MNTVVFGRRSESIKEDKIQKLQSLKDSKVLKAGQIINPNLIRHDNSYDINESISPRAVRREEAKKFKNLERPDLNINFERLSDMSKSGFIEDQRPSSQNVKLLNPGRNQVENSDPFSVNSSISGRPHSAKVRNQRHELERGLIGLNINFNKLRDDLEDKTNLNYKELRELKQDFDEFREQVLEQFLTNKEQLHNRFTEFMAHINDIMLEYKDSILVLQSYVDNQLVVTRRDRIDMNIIIDSLHKKARYHDEVSKNFHFAMKDISSMISAIVEALNINYHLQKQDEKDRESIALMGITQNTHHIDYQKNADIPPISLDKN